MARGLPERALNAPPPDRPAHRPYPEIARAIRSQAGSIVDEWRGRTLFAMPELAGLSRQEFMDHVSQILSVMADALESNDPPDLRRLVETAPSHGLQRFLMDYDLADLFAEERILRRVVVARVEDALGRRCEADEAAALHGMIDIMLQQGVLALVQRQKEQLRQSAEAELKYLSFLSHDLGNNLFVITSTLETLQLQIAGHPDPELRGSAETLAAALKVVTRTARGMRALLMHERLRKGGAGKPRIGPVNLREVVDAIVKVIEDDAAAEGCTLDVSIDQRALAHTDASLLTIILQNLIGNAVRHACPPPERGGGGGMVRMEAEHRAGAAGDKGVWKVSITDNGPGIPAEQLDHLFEPFRNPPGPGGARNGGREPPAGGWAAGAGLGLSIAAQAATMIGTRIDVETRSAEGSTFSFLVPAA